jgi:hypothetical protein
MSGNRFKWLLDHGRLSMPSADRLGDPLEGTTPHGELEWWKREAERANSEEHKIVEHNRAFMSRMAQGLRGHYYVSCWHMNSYESHGMWGCYTKAPQSLAIRTTYAALRESLPRDIHMGAVRYADYATARLPTMNMFEYIMHKDTYYDFEREVRAVAIPPAGNDVAAAEFFGDLFEREDTPGFRVFAPTINMARLVSGVVLHPEAPDAFGAEMRDLCAAKGLPVPEPSRRNRPPAF